VLYATAPEQSVVGWFDVDGIEVAAPSTLWRRFGRCTSLSRREFDEYFDGCSKGVAIKVGTVHELPQRLSLRDLGDLVPPQGFVYLGDDALEVLRDSHAGRGELERSLDAAAAPYPVLGVAG